MQPSSAATESTKDPGLAENLEVSLTINRRRTIWRNAVVLLSVLIGALTVDAASALTTIPKHGTVQIQWSTTLSSGGDPVGPVTFRGHSGGLATFGTVAGPADCSTCTFKATVSVGSAIFRVAGASTFSRIRFSGSAGRQRVEATLRRGGNAADGDPWWILKGTWGSMSATGRGHLSYSGEGRGTFVGSFTITGGP
jgi:hypothetical protein